MAFAYKILPISVLTNRDADTVEKVLANQSNNGWDLISVINGKNTFFIFKRLKGY